MPHLAFEPPGFAPGFVGGGAPGAAGGSFGAVVPTVRGFCVAFSSGTLEESPIWYRLDDPTGPFVVQSVSIDRGRAYEFDRTSTGTASVTIVDVAGEFDPTNTTGAFYGQLEPLKQAAYALQNPVTGVWSTVFRGFVSDWSFSMHPTEDYLMVRVDLVDGLDVLANAELVPGGAFGDTVPALYTGNVVYRALDTPSDLNAVQTRINQVLDDVGWPGGLREVFTGNVKLQGVGDGGGAGVYAPRTAALSVILDAADSEFPGVANFYISKDGKATFHGRYPRFQPTNPTYHITTWPVGDVAAVAASPTTVCPIVPPLEFHRDKEHLYTSALATPNGIDDGDIGSQVVTDATTMAAKGRRTWSAEGLLTAGGLGTTAAVETKKFATYHVDNYKTARTRIRQVTVKAALSSGNTASTTWALACGVDISDRLLITTTHSGGGGFNDYYFVEGVHYDIRPMRSTNHEVTVTLDVSPAGWYGSFPS